MDIMSLKFLWNFQAKRRAGDKTDGISTIHKQTVIESIKVNKGKGKKCLDSYEKRIKLEPLIISTCKSQIEKEQSEVKELGE